MYVHKKEVPGSIIIISYTVPGTHEYTFLITPNKNWAFTNRQMFNNLTVCNIY
ncbi:MAG: hypothetical protein JWQ34_273 [Mucilaginibacter sp.]|nr:hypothetical protein [Mucilaginibacter sp.]